MGRAILIVVILISTIYAGIIVNVQKEMYKLPEVIVDNLLAKELENVSDYALRAAVRMGTENNIMVTGVDSMLVDMENDRITSYGTAGTVIDTVLFSRPYTQGNCTVNKIFYKRVGSDYIEAKTYVRGILQGKTVDYDALIAYDYPSQLIDGPLVLYNDYGSQTHTPDELPDQSNHISGIPMDGLVTAIGTAFSNIIHYSPLGLDKYYVGGGGTHKCLEFGAAMTNGKNNIGAWVQCPDPFSPNKQLLLDRLKTYDQFTVALYAIPQKIKSNEAAVTNTGSGGVTVGGNTGVLYWAASNPDYAKYGQNGYDRPSAAIWYDSYVASSNTVTMHYGVTIDDATVDGTYMEIIRPGCPIYSNMNQGVWHMYTMTFLNGVLTAYYDANVVDTKTATGGSTIQPNDYGFTLGMRDIRSDLPFPLCPSLYKHPGTNYMFYNGLLDQITYWDVALTPEDVENWFNNYIDATDKLYIKD